MFKERFSRRTFLKAAATTAVCSDLFSFQEWSARAEAAEVTQVPSICGACSAWCGMWIHVKNGRIWKVTGQKDHPSSRGRLCARGHAGAMWPYNKDRITQPMKRVGDDMFVPVSWEQAYSEIAARLKTVLDQHGPGSVFFSQNPKPTSSFYMGRLMDAIGAPTVHSHHALCSTGRDVANKWTTGAMATADMAKTNYVLFLGRSYADGISPSATASLAASHARGATIVIVDPRQNSSCILADEWVPIRPGTDLALLLAVANVLISENLYDAAFVEQYTTGFREFYQSVHRYTPEWAEGETTIPAATIYRIARSLGAKRPAACIEQGYKAPNGANYANGTQTFRMMACVNALLGNYGQGGGMKFPVGPHMGSLDAKTYPAPPKPKIARSDGVGAGGKYPLCQTSQGIPHLMPKLALEGKVKAGFIYSFNPARNAPDPELMMKGYRALDLLVVSDIQWSETAMAADYVLPECSFAEREDLPVGITSGSPAVAMRCQAIEVLHPDTKPFEEMVTGLARAMGHSRYFNFSREEAAAAMLKPLGLTADDLRQRGTVVLTATPGELAFATKSGKIELYSQAFADSGQAPVPEWQPPLSRADADNFVLIHGKQGIMSHTATANLPQLLTIAKTYDLERLWLNAGRAARLGIRDGDLVEVASPQAVRRIRVKVTERIHPEAAFLPAGYGNFSPGLKTAYHFGVSPNDFTPHRVEAIAGHAMMMEVTVKVRKVVTS
ncbi:MAG: molybdopterin-dependent oxidoreductase [Negativicutes bacterium]|nr:molybdopterin-dependent oxidoreductase [Negativicutes bacterium]